MAVALRIDTFSASSGMVRLSITDGQSPLPAEAEGKGLYVSVDELERMVQSIKDGGWRDIALAALLFRADAIDPNHGAQFRNALVGHFVTLDPASNNMVIRT